MARLIKLATILFLFGLFTSIDALYSPSSPVLQLTPSNFKSKVLDFNRVKALTPIWDWEKAATVLEGVATVAALIVDAHQLAQETNLAPPEVLTELTSEVVFEEKCGPPAICLVAFLPDILDSKGEGRNLQLLLKVAEMFTRSHYSGLDFVKYLLFITKAISSLTRLQLPEIENYVKIPFLGSVHVALFNINQRPVLRLGLPSAVMKPAAGVGGGPRKGEKGGVGLSSVGFSQAVPVREHLEEGEVAEKDGKRTVIGQEKATPVGGFGEQAEVFWQVKTAENRAAGAGKQLKFHKELLSASEIVVTEEVWSRSSADWMWTLVGWIFGPKPILGKLKGFIRSKWGDERVVSVSEMKPGIFVFKFFKEEEFDRILALGPWSFDNRPLILKPWSPDENYELESVASLPIWVRFPGLNLHMRSEEILSMLASTVGKPIRTDAFTASNENLSYARVLVEIFAANDLKTQVCIKGPRGTNYSQGIEYEWVPPRCNHCQSFGHSLKQCKLPMFCVEDGETEVVVDRVMVKPVRDSVEVATKEDASKKKKVVVSLVNSAIVVRDEGSSSSHDSIIPATALNDLGSSGVLPDKKLCINSSSLEKVSSDSLLDSKLSVDVEGPFTEVKRKVKKKKSGKEKMTEMDMPIGLLKLSGRSKGKGAHTSKSKR
ncbi:unnamed protein product [Rhodiola kirilowii]